MSNIFEERSDLEKINRSIFSFTKKSHRISELKESFITKLDEAEKNEDVDKAKVYFMALLRTVNLSHLVYHNMIKVINDDYNKISLGNVDSRQEIEKLIAYLLEKNPDKQQEILAMKTNLQSSQVRIDSFIQNILSGINKIRVDNEQKIIRIENLIEKERANLDDMANKSPKTFFEELIKLKETHSEIIEERVLEEEINKQIRSMLDSTLNFVGSNSDNLKNEMGIFRNSLINIYELLKDKGDEPFNFLVNRGAILEKHASKFAAIVVGLSAVSALATLAGLGLPAAIFGGAFSIIATGGEALQALPFVKKKLGKLDQKISNVVNEARHIDDNKKYFLFT